MRKLPLDISLILVLSISLAFFLFLDLQGIVRSMIGFIYLTFIPGYMILRLFFRTLDFFRLLIFSIPVSLAVDTIVGMASNGLFPNINQLYSQYIVIEFVLVVLAVFGYFGKERPPRIQSGIFFAFVMVLGIIGLVLGLQRHSDQSAGDEVALYFIGIGEQGFPLEIPVDTAVTITVGVELGESAPVPVQLVCTDSGIFEIIGEKGTTVFFDYIFIEPNPGNYQLECHLYDTATMVSIRQIKMNIVVSDS